MFRTILVASVLALGLSGAAMAHGGHFGGHGHGGHTGHHGDRGGSNDALPTPDQTVTGSISALDEAITGLFQPSPPSLYGNQR